VIFELPAQELEEKEGDQLDEILTPEEWETLGQLSDSAVLAQALGVQRRRAQQKSTRPSKPLPALCAPGWGWELANLSNWGWGCEMSGMATGLTLAHLPTEDHSTLAVALVLADQADGEGGKVFPSIPFIATLARLSERQTQYVMRDLERVGFLILEKKGGGRGNPSRYRIDLEWLKAQPNRITEFREKREKIRVQAVHR